MKKETVQKPSDPDVVQKEESKSKVEDKKKALVHINK